MRVLNSLIKTVSVALLFIGSMALPCEPSILKSVPGIGFTENMLLRLNSYSRSDFSGISVYSRAEYADIYNQKKSGIPGETAIGSFDIPAGAVFCGNKAGFLIGTRNSGKHIEIPVEEDEIKYVRYKSGSPLLKSGAWFSHGNRRVFASLQARTDSPDIVYPSIGISASIKGVSGEVFYSDSPGSRGRINLNLEEDIVSFNISPHMRETGFRLGGNHDNIYSECGFRYYNLESPGELAENYACGFECPGSIFTAKLGFKGKKNRAEFRLTWTGGTARSDFYYKKTLFSEVEFPFESASATAEYMRGPLVFSLTAAGIIFEAEGHFQPFPVNSFSDLLGLKYFLDTKKSSAAEFSTSFKYRFRPGGFRIDAGIGGGWIELLTSSYYRERKVMLLVVPVYSDPEKLEDISAGKRYAVFKPELEIKRGFINWNFFLRAAQFIPVEIRKKENESSAGTTSEKSPEPASRRGGSVIGIGAEFYFGSK